MDSKFDKEFLKLKCIIEDNFNLKEFKEMEKMLSKNKQVEELITQIKILQKKIIFLETINKTSTIAELENKILEIKSKLENIPIYNQYKEKKHFLNKELININDYINEQLNKQIGLDIEEE